MFFVCDDFFLVLFSPFIGKAQNSSKTKCNWVWKDVTETRMIQVWDYELKWYKTVPVPVSVRKPVQECIPISAESNSVKSSSKEPSNINTEPSREASPNQQTETQEAWKFRAEANLLLEQKKFVKAISSYTMSINLTSNDALSYLGRANAKLGLKNYREAIADYDRAIQIFSKWKAKEEPNTNEAMSLYFYSEAYHIRGIAKQFLGDKVGASEDFRKACILGFDKSC
jgi:tetratricopeptide (TPR) repeat protein